MDEPRTIVFNRQVSQSVYLFWLVEVRDFGFFIPGIFGSYFVFESFWLFMWMWLAFIAYVLAFRAGRPRGYDRHFFASLSAAHYLRPGRSDSKSYVREPKQT